MIGAVENIETWKAVFGFEGLYEVSNHGRVKSLERLVGEGRKRRINRGRILRPKPNSHYREVKLRKNNQQFMKTIHRAVLEAFVGCCPPEMECRHLDGNRANNKLENLMWGTRIENMNDTKRHGTFVYGEKHKNAKFDEKTALHIRLSTEKIVDLAEQFGVSIATISRIKSGQRWKYINA